MTLDAGPLLVVGADLLTRALDPGDLLIFFNGNLAARFIDHANQVPQRVWAVEWTPDPGGRQRVNAGAAEGRFVWIEAGRLNDRKAADIAGALVGPPVAPA